MRRWRESEEHLRKEHPGKAERPEGRQDKEAEGQIAKVWGMVETMPPTSNQVGATVTVQAEDRCDPTESVRESRQGTVWHRTPFTRNACRGQIHRDKKVTRGCLGVRGGEGSGTPLQYSCLENPVDGGAWWAAVHGVAKSRIRLSDFTFTHWRRKWHPTPVFLPGESQGRGSLAGCCL